MEEPHKIADRFSGLPESIIHQIMNKLAGKHLARTAVLSKNWYALRHSFPYFQFYESHFRRCSSYSNSYKSSKNLLNIAKQALKKFVQHDTNNHGIVKFDIELCHYDAHLYSALVDLIRIVVDNKVRDLVVFVDGNREGSSRFCVPVFVFECESIRVMELVGCELVWKVNGFGGDRFNCLRILKLSYCYVDERFLRNVLCCSPLIEELYLWKLRGVKKVRVDCLSKVKVIEVEVFRDNVFEVIDVEGAPSLESFKFVDRYHSRYVDNFEGFRCSNINVGSCRGLRLLNVHANCIVDSCLGDLLSRLPFLESLELESCYSLQRVKISSASLRRLCVHGCGELSDVEIDAPSLLLFSFKGDPVLLSSINVSNGCEAKVCFSDTYQLQGADTIWFLRMRKFISLANNQFRHVTLSVMLNKKVVFAVEKLPETVIPEACKVEHLELMIHSSHVSNSIIFNGLLWSCRPTVISVRDIYHPKAYLDFVRNRRVHMVYIECCTVCHFECWQKYYQDEENRMPMKRLYQDIEKRMPMKRLEEQVFVSAKASSSPCPNIAFHFVW